MEVKFNKLDNVTAEITIDVEAGDYQEEVKKQLKEIRRTHQEPGFRAGHVPAGVINKKYGKRVKLEAVNKLVSDELFKYIRDNKLRVLGNPESKADNEFDIDADNYSLSFIVGLAPEFDTHVNKDLTIPYYTIKVSDEMIDNQDQAMRRRLGDQVAGEEVEPNALVKGVITELDADGKPKAEGIVVENGILSPQYFRSDDQKKLFEGKKVGETVVFNPAATCDSNPAEMSSMLNISKDEIDAHKGDFAMEIREIIVLRPAELNQEYYDKLFGADKVHDEKEYREAIKQQIAAQLASDSNFRFTIDARDRIMEAIGEIELPDEILKNFLVQNNEGLTREKVDEDWAKIRKDLEWQIIRDEIAEKLEIKIDENDLKQLAKMIAANQLAQYGMTGLTDEMLDQYAQNILQDKKGRQQIATQAADMKLYNAIRASVNADNKEVTVEEFNKLFTDAK